MQNVISVLNNFIESFVLYPVYLWKNATLSFRKYIDLIIYIYIYILASDSPKILIWFLSEQFEERERERKLVEIIILNWIV